MEINVAGINKQHEKAINKGFAPWNIYRWFKHKDGGVVQLKFIGYEFGGDIRAVFEAADHKFSVDLGYYLDDYEIISQ